jgi:LssY-like putative type I secretion system component LssY
MPVSRQLLSGQPQDMAWQKSFNSYDKREHLRLWSQSKTIQGEQAWLSAYTRETGAALSVKYRKFVHHIDGNLLDGVNMLVRDLALAGAWNPCTNSLAPICRTPCSTPPATKCARMVTLPSFI